MRLKDLFVTTAIAGSSLLGTVAKAQDSKSPATEQTQVQTQDTVLLGDFDITDYAEAMEKRGFDVQLDRSGVGVYRGTSVPMLEVVSTRKVGDDEITVTDYLIHRQGRDFDKNTSDGDKYGPGDLESRELTVKDARKSVEYTLNVDYNAKDKSYFAVSNVVGTGTREIPAMTASDATLLLSRIGSNPESFIAAEGNDIRISRRDADGGGKNQPKR